MGRMFSIKEIRSDVASQLMRKLSPMGFEYKKSDNEFFLKQNDWTFIFNMLLTKWSDSVSLEVRLFISQKKIEDIYETVLGKSHRLTLGNTIQRIYKSPDGRQVVNGNMDIVMSDNEDILAAVESLEGYYENIAKPYYERYKSLEAIDDIINKPPFEHCPAHVGGRFDNRCMKGLIVARLVNNPKYEHLVTLYDEAIKMTMDSESIESYYKVKNYLSYNRIN